MKKILIILLFIIIATTGLQARRFRSARVGHRRSSIGVHRGRIGVSVGPRYRRYHSVRPIGRYSYGLWRPWRRQYQVWHPGYPCSSSACPWWTYRSFPLFFTGGLYFNLVQANRWNDIERELNARISQLEYQLEIESKHRKRQELEQKLREVQQHLALTQKKLAAEK